MNRSRSLFLLIVSVFFLVSCAKEKRVGIGTHFWAIDSFSPNNDGLNEVFYITPIYGVDIPEFHISIYDQDLRLVYQSNDITEGWNGKLANSDAPEGYYEYQILYTASVDSATYDDYITSARLNLFR